VTSFGNGLKVGIQSAVLPLKLISFSGNRSTNIIQLKWVTANEESGDRFEVERSTDGLHFETIHTLNANGTLNSEYAFTDDFSAGNAYYRIKIISSTGRSFYSRVIVFRNTDLLTDIRLMGNPVYSNLIVQAVVRDGGKLNLRLSDMSGKIVLQKQVIAEAGINQLNVDLPKRLSAGTYILDVSGNDIKKSMRVMVIK
jgi:hypothetical protein